MNCRLIYDFTNMMAQYIRINFLTFSKTYFRAIEEDPNVSIRKTLQKPYFISSRVMIDDLFNGFKKHHTHLALVRDRNHHVIGMVTMEDVLEELVSDISEPTTHKRVRKSRSHE